MKKWALACFSIISFLFSTQEIDKDTCVLESAVIGSKYGLYLDESCEIPLLDTDGKPIVLDIVEEKQIFQMHEEQIYAKQIASIDGYYLDENIYALQGTVTFTQDPISVTIQSDIYPITVEVIDENQENISTIKLEEDRMLDDSLVAGKTYAIHVKDTFAYAVYPDVTFSIPMSKPEKDIVLSLQKEVYGTMNLLVKDQEENVVKNGVYALWQDDKQVQDIYGHTTEREVDEAGKISWDMPKGKYMVKQVAIDDAYYINAETASLECEPSSILYYEKKERKILFSVEMVDAEKQEQIPGKIQYLDRIIDSGSTISLKRGDIVSFFDIQHPDGFYKADTTIQKVVDVYDGNDTIQLLAQPFTASFYTKDVDTGQSVNGVYQILDENNQVVIEASTKEGILETRSLHDETQYIFHEVQCEDGYIAAIDMPFMISKEQSTYVIDKVPYVYVNQSITSNGLSVEGKIGIYENFSCSIRAKDIYGRDIDRLQNTRVRNGTYFVKIDSLDSHFYNDISVLKITINHTNSIHKTIHKDVQPVTMHASLKTEEGEDVQDFKIEVCNTDGEVLDTITDFHMLEKANSILERDKQYAMRVSHIDGLYTYDKKTQMITFSNQVPSQIPTIAFVCDPYVQVKVDGIGEYGIYEDQSCTVLSKDIFGRFTKKSGNVEWMLRPGEYWLKEMHPAAGYYENIRVHKLELKHREWNYNTKIISTPIALRVSVVDENGKEINDAHIEIQDESGIVLEEIHASMDMVGPYLKPSMRLLFHEIDVPNGYVSNNTDIVYTLPDTVPSSTPILKITYKSESVKYSVVNKQEDSKIEVLDETKQTNFTWILIPVMGIIIVCIWLKNRHQG